jgi:hypothetical protein
VLRPDLGAQEGLVIRSFIDGKEVEALYHIRWVVSAIWQPTCWFCKRLECDVRLIKEIPFLMGGNSKAISRSGDGYSAGAGLVGGNRLMEHYGSIREPANGICTILKTLRN